MLTPMSTDQPGANAPKGQPENPDTGARALRPRSVPAPGLWRRPVEPDVVGERLTVLVHELSGLVDGSIRQVAALLRAPAEGAALRKDAEDTSARLRTVAHALERMAEAIRTASGAAPSPWLQASYSATLADALRYAAGIMEPIATERGVRVHVTLDERLSLLAPGHMYTVAVNAVRNAIEAVVARGPKGAPGHIELTGAIEQQGAREWVVIEVRDNGIGPPAAASAGAVFEPDFSTKPGGLGVGLALSRQIVEQAGGSIELLPRFGASGALLRVRFPADATDPASHPGHSIG
jgi:signal transduction histidine kinase